MLHLTLQLLLFLLSTIDFFLICLVTFLLSFLPTRWTRSFMPWLFSQWCKAFLRMLGIEYHIHHKFKPPLLKHYLLISNHPSGLDILILNALFPVRPLAKEEIRSWWILGRIARGIGSVFVKREDKESRHNAKQVLIDVLQRGDNLLIYPEGGCFGKHLRPFKYGPFEMALATGTPILPVYMQYEAENDTEWGDYGLLHHLFNLRLASNKHAHAYIFDPIDPKSFTEVEALTNHVHSLYEKWEAKYRL